MPCGDSRRQQQNGELAAFDERRNPPLSVVEAIVGHGHSNPAMTRHYTHVSELAAASAVNALPSVMGESTPALLPPGDPLASFKSKVTEMGTKLNGQNWRTVKREMLAIGSAVL